MTPTHLQLRFTLLSDATFGRGDGVAGLVDEEIEHDTFTGLPYLRGRTLKGLLVEECANILYVLRGNPAYNLLQQAARDLFGNPGSTLDDDGLLHIGHAQLPQTLRDAIATDVQAERLSANDATATDVQARCLSANEVLESLTAIRRQTAVDDDGAPERESLRAMRVLMRDLPLQADLTAEASLDDRHLAMLVACALGLRRAGIGRNRGRGRLGKMQLHDLSIAEGETEITQKAFDKFANLVKGRYAMAVLTYQIRFLEPVLVTKLDGDPNSNISHDYLPGSVLRAALLGRFASDNNVAVKDVLEDERTKADAARLFFGRARFLNAYPVDRLNNRTLPKPLSWRQSKSARSEVRDDEKHKVPIYDFAIAQRDNDQYQRAEGIFCFMGDRGSTVRLVSPERQVMIHTQRASRDGKRNYGRALKGDGAVYRYESLAAGQVFAAVILCDEADAELFESLLKGEYSLGGARTAGYGRVRIENAKRMDAWREAPGQIEDPAHELIVTLTSDVLLRNPHGQYVADAELLARHIAERLGVEASLEQAFVSAHPVGGFNRKWGLPLPQALAFEMGSVLVLKLAQSVSTDRLRDLEESGIGERRIDGFGRLVFNWQYREEPSIEAPVRNEPAPKSIGGDALSKEVAQRMAERILRARMEAQLMAQAGRIHIERSPGRTQLSRLRNIVLDELRQPKPTQITRGQETKSRLQWFLDDILKRRVTREAWERARVNDKPLVKWIKDVHDADVNDADKWRRAVGLSYEEVPKVRVGDDVSAELTTTMRREFSLRLIAEVLRRAAK